MMECLCCLRGTITVRTHSFCCRCRQDRISDPSAAAAKRSRFMFGLSTSEIRLYKSAQIVAQLWSKWDLRAFSRSLRKPCRACGSNRSHGFFFEALQKSPKPTTTLCTFGCFLKGKLGVECEKLLSLRTRTVLMFGLGVGTGGGGGFHSRHIVATSFSATTYWCDTEDVRTSVIWAETPDRSIYCCSLFSLQWTIKNAAKLLTFIKVVGIKDSFCICNTEKDQTLHLLWWKIVKAEYWKNNKKKTTLHLMQS